MSNANEDFPEPDNPVNTIILFRGNSREIFFKLCSRAPLIEILLCIKTKMSPSYWAIEWIQYNEHIGASIRGFGMKSTWNSLYFLYLCFWDILRVLFLATFLNYEKAIY